MTKIILVLFFFIIISVDFAIADDRYGSIWDTYKPETIGLRSEEHTSELQSL
jgi:hypothetical protein